MKEHHVIDSLLSKRQNRLYVLEKEILEIRSEIRVLKEVKDKLSTPISNKKRRSAQITSKKRGRKLDRKWKAVLRFIGQHHQVSLDDIITFIKQKDYPITRSNLRVQLNSYMQKDWVRRVQKSVYTLTESGLEKCEYGYKTEPSIATTTEGSKLVQDGNPSEAIESFSGRSLEIVRNKGRVHN